MSLIGKRFLPVAAFIMVLTIFVTACGSGTANNGKTSGSNTPTKADSAAPAGIDIELGKNGPVKIDFWHIQASIYGDAIKQIVANFKQRIRRQNC